MSDKIILDTDPEAAELKTLTGWVSRDGYYFGDDKRTARYRGCTHRKCECGKLMEKMYTKCESCRAEGERKRYELLPFEEWDYQRPICTLGGDNYFFDEDEIIDYLEDNELKPEDLRLVICEPNPLKQIPLDMWEDDLAEDQELPEELVKKINELNMFIDEQSPISYSPGKVRTKYKPSEIEKNEN